MSHVPVGPGATSNGAQPHRIAPLQLPATLHAAVQLKKTNNRVGSRRMLSAAVELEQSFRHVVDGVLFFPAVGVVALQIG